ncbi:hypothetical protein AgCh_029277 [Apium graveolens]
MRFGNKGKLSPRYMGPYEIIERVGPLAYKLALPLELSQIHNIFHVSMLRRYRSDPTHVLKDPEIEIYENASYIEKPVEITGQKITQLRNREIPLVKVLWRNHTREEATWETEESMRRQYPYLFNNTAFLAINVNYEPLSKSWDGTDDENNYEEHGNYALLILEQGESSVSKSEVPTLTTIDLNTAQYNETVEKMSVEMFHIHTSMMGAIEENKLKCAGEVEAVLRERTENNEMKLKPFKNASQLPGQYHEKNKSYANIAIGLDYDALNSNKKNECDKGKSIANQDNLVMLRKVDVPLYKACEVNFSEVELVIKQELADEDGEKKDAETTTINEREKKPIINQIIKTPTKEAVSEPKYGACKYNEAQTDDPYSFCVKFDCILCNMKVMTSFHKLRKDLKEVKFRYMIKDENIDQTKNIFPFECSSSTSANYVKKKKVRNTVWFEEMAGPLVTFGDNNKRFTMGYGKVISGNVIIEDITLVGGLEVNLLSVRQFTNKGFKVNLKKKIAQS